MKYKPRHKRPNNSPWFKGLKLGPKIDFLDQISNHKINIKKDGPQKSRYIDRSLRKKRAPSADSHYITKD